MTVGPDWSQSREESDAFRRACCHSELVRSVGREIIETGSCDWAGLLTSLAIASDQWYSLAGGRITRQILGRPTPKAEELPDARETAMTMSLVKRYLDLYDGRFMINRPPLAGTNELSSQWSVDPGVAGEMYTAAITAYYAGERVSIESTKQLARLNSHQTVLDLSLHWTQLRNSMEPIDVGELERKVTSTTLGLIRVYALHLTHGDRLFAPGSAPIRWGEDHSASLTNVMDDFTRTALALEDAGVDELLYARYAPSLHRLMNVAGFLLTGGHLPTGCLGTGTNRSNGGTAGAGSVVPVPLSDRSNCRLGEIQENQAES